MAFDKRWTSTSSGVYTTDTNWAEISVRNAGYSWTVSGSGTNEYYLRTAASGDPGFASAPTKVYIGGTVRTEGTAGSLTDLQWDYGDNDSLGYSTIYIRLDAGDPDSQALDYVTFRQIPVAGDHVRIPAGTASISSGLQQAAVAIGDFIVEKGYTGDIGSSTGYLQIDPNRFEFSATGGEAYIDVTTASNLDCQVFSTGNAATGERGLYLKGSSIDVLNISGGSVGVAVVHGDSATVATARLDSQNASLWIGEGCTLTTYQQRNGTGILRCAATTVLTYGGTLTTEEIGAITTVNQKGGTIVHNSSGTVTTWNLYGGVLDERQSGVARTISTLNKYSGNWQIYRNKEAVTHTTETYQDSFTETATPV